MNNVYSNSPNLDQILDAIRAEANRRGAKGKIGLFSTGPSAIAQTPHPFGDRTAIIEIAHVIDLLMLSVDDFIVHAYRSVLGREADTTGFSHYQKILMRGWLARAEVLGRLRLSPEGRAKKCALPGLFSAFIFASAYRLPVLGPVFSLVAAFLRFPSHMQDRHAVEQSQDAMAALLRRY